jgi:thymidylate synthase (FAD)
MPEREIKCLDKGFVKLVDYMGSDTRIVDAARVSYQQGTKAVQTDRHLIRYLVRNLHTTPLEKAVFEFHVKCPMFIGEQFLRHRTGSFNKISGRYSEMKDEFYIPDPVRRQSVINRQGSAADEVIEQIGSYRAPIHFEDSFNHSYEDYTEALEAGVARELARAVLPASLYTEFYWTVNLWNLMHFLKLRLDTHAQLEIRVFAEAIYQLIKDNCELSFALEAFQDYILDDPKLSKYELEILTKCLNRGPYSEDVDFRKDLNKQYIQQLIQAHPDMSKREKQESKLIELLFPDSDDQVQPNVQEQVTPDT